jgi:hypothetical protein
MVSAMNRFTYKICLVVTAIVGLCYLQPQPAKSTIIGPTISFGIISGAGGKVKATSATDQVKWIGVTTNPITKTITAIGTGVNTAHFSQYSANRQPEINSKVKSVSATSPLVSSGGTTPTISLASVPFGNNSTGMRAPLAAKAPLTGVGTSGTWPISIIGNAGTATALAANGTNCTGVTVAQGVDASGNAESCITPAGTYSLPTATSSVLGGVKPDGTTITNTAGAISVANPLNQNTTGSADTAVQLVTKSTSSPLVNIYTVPSRQYIGAGGTVDFAGFSGMIMVNRYDTGAVTIYLAGGGSVTVVSSVGAQVGSLANHNAIYGYTWTNTGSTSDIGFFAVCTRSQN